MGDAFNPAPAPIDSSKAQFDDALFRSIEDMRAAYEQQLLAPFLGQLVDITIDGTREERHLAAAPVQIIAYASDWTGEPVSLLRRVREFLLGRDSAEPHASAAGRT